MKCFLIALCSIVFATGVAPANDLGLGSDTQDVIFLTAEGPVRLRYHLHQASKTVTQQWTSFADEIFAYADRNSDGKLDKEEIRLLSLLPVGKGNSGYASLGGVFVPMASPAPQAKPFELTAMDTDNNGSVSRDEFAATLVRTGSGPVEVVLTNSSGNADQVTKALFSHLDKDKDGKLSKAEIDASMETLIKLDQDEDEMITADELLDKAPRNSNPYQIFQPIALSYESANGTANPSFSSRFISLRREASSQEHVKELLARLDKKKKGSLTAVDLKMSTTVFGKLDKNGNGRLDAEELAAWLASAPDIDISMPLGGSPNAMNQMMTKNPAKQKSMEFSAAKGSDWEKKITKGGDGIERLALANAVMRLSADQQIQRGFVVVNFAQADGQFDEIFKKAAGSNKGIDKTKFKEIPEIQYLQGYFDAADRNGDGILELAEWKKFVAIQSAGNDVQVEIHIANEGRSLLDLIDANHDGRLSVREMRNAWVQLAPLSKDGKYIVQEDLPQQIPTYVRRANLTQNTGGLFSLSVSSFYGSTRAVGLSPNAQRVPVWFLKMDRNGDGDVSRKEFLGPLELFDRLDKDGDGLISSEEAIRAEKDRK